MIPCFSLAQPFIFSVVQPFYISCLADSSRILSVCHLHLVVLIDVRVEVFTELPCYSVKLLSSLFPSTSLTVNFLSLQTMMKLQMESLWDWMSLAFHLMFSWPFGFFFYFRFFLAGLFASGLIKMFSLCHFFSFHSLEQYLCRTQDHSIIFPVFHCWPWTSFIDFRQMCPHVGCYVCFSFSCFPPTLCPSLSFFSLKM